MNYKVLFLCDFNRFSANTIIDHAMSFKTYSKHDIFFYNPFSKNHPKWLDLNEFDIIIIHYSIYVLGESYLNETWRSAVSKSSAMKVQFIQDEYRTVNAIHNKMRELNIDVLFTCYPENEIEKVYPITKFSYLKKYSTLTGYVPEYLEATKPNLNNSRSIDVGYRARGLGFWWLGELYQEKSRIGKEFLYLAQDSSVTCDISSKEEDRIYGKGWIAFLKNSRCTLGTESGASVIDFTGEVEMKVKEYSRLNPDATFEEVQDLFFKDLEGKIKMNQISPRIFEAIGCGCCLILFEGNYSGILKPDIHYIELKKDFSNIKSVLAKIKDDTYVKNMAERAYEDIIASGKYSYRSFVRYFDKKIEECMKEERFNRDCRITEDPNWNDIKADAINNSGTITCSCTFRTNEADIKKKPLTKKIISYPVSLIKYSFHKLVSVMNYFVSKYLNFLWRIKLLFKLHPFFFKEKLRLILHVFKMRWNLQNSIISPNVFNKVMESLRSFSKIVKLTTRSRSIQVSNSIQFTFEELSGELINIEDTEYIKHVIPWSFGKVIEKYSNSEYEVSSGSDIFFIKFYLPAGIKTQAYKNKLQMRGIPFGKARFLLYVKSYCHLSSIRPLAAKNDPLKDNYDCGFEIKGNGMKFILFVHTREKQDYKGSERVTPYKFSAFRFENEELSDVWTMGMDGVINHLP